MIFLTLNGTKNYWNLDVKKENLLTPSLRCWGETLLYAVLGNLKLARWWISSILPVCKNGWRILWPWIEDYCLKKLCWIKGGQIFRKIWDDNKKQKYLLHSKLTWLRQLFIEWWEKLIYLMIIYLIQARSEILLRLMVIIWSLSVRIQHYFLLLLLYLNGFSITYSFYSLQRVFISTLVLLHG